MKKKSWIKIILISLPVVILLILSVKFLRFNQPFSSLISQWDQITIYNYLPYNEPLTITDSAQLQKIYEVLGDVSVTTAGLGTDRNGYGFFLTNGKYDIYLHTDIIMYQGIRYTVSDQTYLDEIYAVLDDLSQ